MGKAVPWGLIAYLDFAVHDGVFFSFVYVRKLCLQNYMQYVSHQFFGHLLIVFSSCWVPGTYLYVVAGVREFCELCSWPTSNLQTSKANIVHLSRRVTASRVMFDHGIISYFQGPPGF